MTVTLTLAIDRGGWGGILWYMIQWNLYCHERPPVLTDRTFLVEGPTFQYNWTCHQRPPVSLDRPHFCGQWSGLSRQVLLYNGYTNSAKCSGMWWYWSCRWQPDLKVQHVLDAACHLLYLLALIKSFCIIYNNSFMLNVVMLSQIV